MSTATTATTQLPPEVLRRRPDAPQGPSRPAHHRRGELPAPVWPVPAVGAER